jgi:hypothetical protein
MPRENRRVGVVQMRAFHFASRSTEIAPLGIVCTPDKMAGEEDCTVELRPVLADETSLSHLWTPKEQGIIATGLQGTWVVDFFNHRSTIRMNGAPDGTAHSQSQGTRRGPFSKRSEKVERPVGVIPVAASDKFRTESRCPQLPSQVGAPSS